MFASIEGFNSYGQEALIECTDCQSGRREKIRGCLSIWGNFSDGEAGGFLATGSKRVCARDRSNSCADEWLTGCVSSFE